MAASNQSTSASLPSRGDPFSSDISITNEQLLALMKAVASYGTGNVELTTLGGNSNTSPHDAGTSAVSNTGTIGVSPTVGLGMASQAVSMAATLGQDPGLANVSSALGLAAAISQAVDNPNTANVAQAVAQGLSIAGVPGIGLATGIATQGFNTSTALGLMGMVNPAFGLAGIANSIAGNPIGAAVEGLGNTLGNPNSMGLAEQAGISFGQQMANAINQSQSEQGYDTEGMQGLVDAIGIAEGMEGYGPSDSDSDGDSDGDGGGDSDGDGDSGGW